MKYQVWVKLPESEDAPEIRGEVLSEFALDETIEAFEKQGFEVSITYTKPAEPSKYIPLLS